MPQHTAIDNLPAWRPQAPKRTTCGQTCPGGRACILSDRVHHAWHICANPSCACHQTRREETQRENVPTCQRANA